MAKSIAVKCQDAFKALLSASSAGIQATIYTGKDFEEKQAPMVGCGAETAREDPVDTGNYWVDVEIVIKSMAPADQLDNNDPKSTSDDLTASVLAVLDVDDLAGQLSSAIEDFHVFGFDADKGMESSQDGDAWVETWKRRVYCCGTTFTT